MAAAPKVEIGSDVVPGPKPQSKAVRAAKGNPGKRAPTGVKNTKPPAPAVDTKPADGKPADLAAAPKVPGGVPRELTKEGKSVWNLIAPMLAKSKLYHATDRIALSRYCDTVSEYWKVTRKLRKMQYTYKVPKVGGGTMLRFNPLFSVQDRLARRLDVLEHQFGLTPRSRQEILYRLQAQVPELPLGGDPTPDVPGPDQAPESPIGFLDRQSGDGPQRVH